LKIVLSTVFLVQLGLFIFTQFPGVAPYRDSGEMATSIYSLGIIHPPGYPLYTLLGKCFINLIPFGNTAYKLNLFSGIFTALSGILILFIIQLLWFPPAQEKKSLPWYLTVSVLVFSTSYLQWYISLVSEMYTLNIFLACLLIYLIIRVLNGNISVKYIYFTAFIFGISLGNRTDILLISPAILYVTYILYNRRVISPVNIITILLLGLLGLSVYLYLPVRSAQNPYFDWNHPVSLEKLWATLTRKSHGGTLDLLSESYKPGENLLSLTKFYLLHLTPGFAYTGLLLGLLGMIYGILKKHLRTVTWWFLLTAFVFTGPAFIFLANMPPNPHALVIVEAHFLLPNLIFFLFIILGIKYIIFDIYPNNNAVKSGVIVLIILMLTINVYSNFIDLNKRENLFTYDHSKNLLKSVTPDSVVIAKKDVQLFSLWYKQTVEKYRQDIITVAEGLAGSPWYQEMMRRRFPGAYICSVTDKSYLTEFIQMNNKINPVYFTGDSDVQVPPGYAPVPIGLVSQFFTAGNQAALINKSNMLFDELYVYRGNYDYDGYREFFTPDLVEDYARARHKLGYYYMNNSNYEQARKNFHYSQIYHNDFFIAAYHTAYTYFIQNDFKSAEQKYQIAINKYKNAVNLAKKYNALPSVKQGIRNELAEIILHYGVVLEKLGKPDDSLSVYLSALEYNPGLSKAYFNRSVIYWQRNDWNSVISELTKAIQIDPNDNQYRYYLELAKRKKYTTDEHK